jgi:virulence-associated protein VapD
MGEVKPYKRKLADSLMANQRFLAVRFAREWELVQKAEKRRGRLEKLKRGGKFLGKALLGFLVFGGVLTVALVAPGVFVVFDNKHHRVFLPEKDFNRIRRDFKRQGLFEFKKSGEDSFKIFVTHKGEKRALNEVFNNLRLDQSRVWDHLWRIVIFDIPNKNKQARDGLRQKLVQLGFYQLQKSVFISPYPCGEEIDFLVAVFGVRDNVHYFTTADLTVNGEIRNYFAVM